MKTAINLCATVPALLNGKRFDLVAASLFSSYSRSTIKKWIESHDLTVNGSSRKPKDKVYLGDAIHLDTVLEDQFEEHPEAMDINYVFEDQHILVISKQAGVVVHPGAGNRSGTLLNGLLFNHPQLAHLPRAGIIHRLDKDTTGLMIIAKTLESYTALVEQMQKREVKRQYVALVNGLLTGGGTVDASIGRHPVNRLKMAVVLGGKQAITHYRIKQRFTAHTYLTVHLETGRTHQIRTHMSHINHPIVGDSVYGAKCIIPRNASIELASAIQCFKRQALHAEKLGLVHPVNKQDMEWTAELPNDMKSLISLLENSL